MATFSECSLNRRDLILVLWSRSRIPVIRPGVWPNAPFLTCLLLLQSTPCRVNIGGLGREKRSFHLADMYPVCIRKTMRYEEPHEVLGRENA